MAMATQSSPRPESVTHLGPTRSSPWLSLQYHLAVGYIMSQPLTPAKLSSLATSTLSSILELTRAHQLSLPATQLTITISRNLTTLNTAITALHQQGQHTEALKGLEAQYDRLVNLVSPLGVEAPPRPKQQGRTGRLVDTGNDDEDDLVAVDGEG